MNDERMNLVGLICSPYSKCILLANQLIIYGRCICLCLHREALFFIIVVLCMFHNEDRKNLNINSSLYWCFQ